jgi:hypothetical protein
MTIPFEKLKKEWLKSPSFRAEYDRLKPEFELALALIQARAKAAMTQADVARKMRTTQSVVARIESDSKASPQGGAGENRNIGRKIFRGA